MGAETIKEERSTVKIRFTPEQKEKIRTFFTYSLNYHDEVNEKLRKELEKDPFWDKLIKMQTEEQAEMQRQRSLKLQKAAIFDGEWDAYDHELLQQGMVYADLNVQYEDWLKVVNLYKEKLLPFISKDFSLDIDQAMLIVEGMTLFVDYAMFRIGTAYIERKNQSIRQLNEELEKKVEQRTEELQEINEELKSFSYTVSHDLRAPLRAIDGFARILSEKHLSDLNSQGKEYLRIITDNISKMEQLIDDLLTLSRIGQKDMIRSSFNIRELFREMFDEIMASNADKEVEFILREMPRANGDRELMKHVIRNLLDNSVKYSSKRKHIEIEVGFKEEEGHNVYFVKDNGAGFDMRYVHKIFGIFERLHSADEFEGTGVGLAIVQRIVHRHGGKVWANSQQDVGTTVFFTLDNQ